MLVETTLALRVEGGVRFVGTGGAGGDGGGEGGGRGGEGGGGRA